VRWDELMQMTWVNSLAVINWSSKQVFFVKCILFNNYSSVVFFKLFSNIFISIVVAIELFVWDNRHIIMWFSFSKGKSKSSLTYGASSSSSYLAMPWWPSKKASWSYSFRNANISLCLQNFANLMPQHLRKLSMKVANEDMIFGLQECLIQSLFPCVNEQTNNLIMTFSCLSLNFQIFLMNAKTNGAIAKEASSNFGSLSSNFREAYLGISTYSQCLAQGITHGNSKELPFIHTNSKLVINTIHTFFIVELPR